MDKGAKIDGVDVCTTDDTVVTRGVTSPRSSISGPAQATCLTFLDSHFASPTPSCLDLSSNCSTPIPSTATWRSSQAKSFTQPSNRSTSPPPELSNSIIVDKQEPSPFPPPFPWPFKFLHVLPYLLPPQWLMTMSSTSKLLKDNGSLPPLLEFSSKTPALTPPIPNVMFAQISVTTGSPASCTPVLPVGNQHWATQHIIVWQPNVISFIDGDTQMRFAIFRSVEDVTPQGMWSITAQLTCLSSQKLATLMEEPILTTMTSTPLWMTTKKIVCVEPGA